MVNKECWDNEIWVQVRLLKGFQQPLYYKIPTEWSPKPQIGTIIKVPIRTQMTPAVVLKTFDQKPETTFDIKDAIAPERFPPDTHYQHFIKKVADFYFIDPVHFYQRIKSFLLTKKKSSLDHQFPSSYRDTTPKEITLTDEQQSVFDYLNPKLAAPVFTPTLVHGVTGSGKTEIYKKLITSSITLNKTVVFLIPEVSLAVQFYHIFKKQLPPNIPVFGFHSASKPKEKRDLWQHLTEQKACLIVGVHLPIMLPIANLGLIIVDEEHETGFQEKKHPKINSKEVAIWRAKQYNIPILLGSATPSVNTLHSLKHSPWKFFQLTRRFSGNFPIIQKVVIDKTRRRNFWITKKLEMAIADRLEKKEQSIIFLNRRGYSFFVQCKKCGFTFECPNCSVSLTVHRTQGPASLHCHYCNYTQPEPKQCPECCAPEKEFLKRGIGTQQIVSILQQLFPEAHIARADLDTTKKKQLWHETVEQFEKQEIDILVGTQTITKGYHFPHVTLVGIIWADLDLHFPVFNANETCIQQLIQVAGRAGRDSKASTVIVQTMQEHPLFDYLNEQDYLTFCQTEHAFRQETLYPPCARLVQIELKNTNPVEIEQDAQTLYAQLQHLNTQKNLALTLLGPARPTIYRVQKTEMRHIFLKASTFGPIFHALKSIDFDQYKSSIFIVPTP